MINFFKNQSDMCETKTVLVSLSKFLLVTASFRKYQAHTNRKWVTMAKSKFKVLLKMSTGRIVSTVAYVLI